MAALWQEWRMWLWPVIALAGSILLALFAHYVLFVFGKRLAKLPGSIIYDSLVERAEGPTRWIFPLIGIVLALPALPVRS
jgi:hypothetical protein